MKKKFFATLSLSMVLLLTACGSSDDEKVETRNTRERQTVKTEGREDDGTSGKLTDGTVDNTGNNEDGSGGAVDGTVPGLIDMISGYEEGKTTAVYYKGEMVPIAGGVTAEDVFIGDYLHEDVTSNFDVPDDADIMKTVNFSREINGEGGYSDIPLAVQFGRGLGDFGGVASLNEYKTTEQIKNEHVKFIDKLGDDEGERLYRNYVIIHGTYTADVRFLQEGKNKLAKQFCRYTVNGNVIHFQGIDVNDDWSYTDNSFSLDMTYNFNGLDLSLECSAGAVELIPEYKAESEDGYDTVACTASSLDGCVEGIFDISSYISPTAKRDYVFFPDGCSGDDETVVDFNRDGTFTISGHRVKKNKDETVNHEHNVSISGEYIGRGSQRGATLIADGTAYVYSKPFGEYDYLLWQDYADDTSKKETAGNNRVKAADRVKEVLGNNPDISVDETTGEITMDSALLFGFDSSDVGDDGKKVLESFLNDYAGVIIELRDEGVITGIEIDGYTDSVGSYSYNIELSQKRAENVMAYVIEKHSELGSMVSAKGLGSDNLIVNADGTINDDASRRVCFRLIISAE